MSTTATEINVLIENLINHNPDTEKKTDDGTVNNDDKKDTVNKLTKELVPYLAKIYTQCGEQSNEQISNDAFAALQNFVTRLDETSAKSAALTALVNKNLQDNQPPVERFQRAVAAIWAGIPKEDMPVLDVSKLPLLNDTTKLAADQRTSAQKVLAFLIGYRRAIGLPAIMAIEEPPKPPIKNSYITANAALALLSLLSTGYMVYKNWIDSVGETDPYMLGEADFLAISLLSSLTLCGSLVGLKVSNITQSPLRQEQLRTMAATGLVAIAGLALIYASLAAFAHGFDAVHGQEEKGLFTFAYTAVGLMGVASVAVGLKVATAHKASPQDFRR